jgi:tRNA pseudouridine38-40 synthase
MKNFKIIFEYDGSDYCGTQKQKDIAIKSIQETLEEAIFAFSGEKIDLQISGRTDAGVHALNQVASFFLVKDFDEKKIPLAINSHLKNEKIAVKDCFVVDNKFNARYNAKMRHYRYIIINRKARLILNKNRAWHIAKNLDFLAMKKAADFFIGEHDFSSFRDAKCQAKSPIKTIEKITLTKNEDEILIDIAAKSFLHHMVRNIVGALAFVGLEKLTSEDIKKIIELKDRKKSPPNAPAYGLYLNKIEY